MMNHPGPIKMFHLAVLPLLLFSFIHTSFGLTIKINPIATIASAKSIESIRFLLHGFLKHGQHDLLLKVIQYPVYDFEPLYIEKVCHLLGPVEVQRIAADSSLSESEKGILLSPACLLAGNVLLHLEPEHSQFLPINLLSYERFRVIKFKPTLLSALLARAIDEKASVNILPIIKAFEDKQLAKDFLANHSWRFMTEEVFCGSSEWMRSFLLNSCLSGIPFLTVRSPREVWAESLQRILAVAGMKRYVQSCPFEHSDEEAWIEALWRLSDHLEAMAVPADPLIRQILALITRLLTESHIHLSNFVSVLEFFPIPLQPDWILGNLRLFIGSEAEFVNLLNSQVLPFKLAQVRDYHGQVMLSEQINNALLSQLGRPTQLLRTPSDTRSLPAKLRRTRVLSLPVSTHHQLLKIHLRSEWQVGPQDRLFHVWQSLKKVDYDLSNAFQFFTFSIYGPEGHFHFRDRRAFYRMFLKDFLEVLELFIRTDTGDIIPSPLCPPSLLRILAVILHQSVLLLQPVPFRIYEDYLSAALQNNQIRLNTIFNEHMCLIAETLAEKSDFAEAFSDEKGPNSIFGDSDCVSAFTKLHDNFLLGASGFSASLRDVFTEEDYSIAEIQIILFNDNKRIT